jgi:ribosome recycling factor
MPAYDKADLDRRMNGAIESFRGDLSSLRTGRANVSLLDPVVVEVYGSNMPLNQVATVSAPEPRMLSVGPVQRDAGRKGDPGCWAGSEPDH